MNDTDIFPRLKSRGFYMEGKWIYKCVCGIFVIEPEKVKPGELETCDKCRSHYKIIREKAAVN